MKFRPFGRGPTTPRIGDENDHHGYYPLSYPIIAYPPTVTFSKNLNGSSGSRLLNSTRSLAVSPYLWKPQKTRVKQMRDFKPENIAQITLKIKEQWVPMVATLKACLFPPTNGPSFKVFHGQGTFHHVEPSDFGLRFFS